jgi:prepilin peptidase CpaA
MITIPQNLLMALLFFPLAVMITYMDVRYRRIPNKLVLAILLVGLTMNTVFGGSRGLLLSLGGLGLAFGIMFFLHVFGTMGAGDVKLFAAIGAVNGLSLVIPTLLVVALTGGVLAICMMVYSGRVRTTMFGVMHFFYGLLPGQKVPRFEIPADRKYTLPYALPICFGSLLSYVLFHG